ncbi:MAG: electron transfer flavoprotein subunit alpha/FixB family protein [Dehalococcoidia bacterium]
MAGILVVAESAGGAATPHSLEMLGAARALSAQGGGGVCAFIAGGEAEAKALIAHGADAVFTSAAPAASLAEVLAPAVEEAVGASGADIVLVAQSSLGRDLAPLLAFRAGTGVAMDCTELKIDGGRLRATRSCYGGNARAEHTWKSALQIATVKGKAFDALEADGGRSGSVTAVAAQGEARIKVTGIEKASSEGIKIEDAAIVVSGGRGLGDGSAFKQLEDLAGTLKVAAVGASRAACDLGWYPPSQQVGLTGKTVSPNLYIAVAISGASQHMAGMGGSKNIVAINKDGDANMVKVSRFAVIDDYKKVLPALIAEIKKLD